MPPVNTTSLPTICGVADVVRVQVGAENEERVASLLAEADALMAIRRFKEAEERARQATALAPQESNTFCTWSRREYGLGQYADAAHTAEEAIRLAPGSPVGFRLRAAAISSLAAQNYGPERSRLGYEAVASACEAVYLAPRDPNGYLRLAEALRLTRELKEADAAVQEAIRLAPNSAATWITASIVALAAKNWETAISASRRALAIEPSNYAAMNNLGVALRGAGKKREGINVLAEAARIDPDRPTARTNLTNARLNVPRIVIMVLLIPIALLPHIGPGLYVVFAVVTNVLISRYPEAVVRTERRATPVTQFLTNHDDDDVLSNPAFPAKDEEKPSTSPWSAMDGRRVVGSSVVRFMAISAWAATLVLLTVCFAVAGADKLVMAAVVVFFAAVATWPTWVLHRRRRALNGRHSA